jgi:hypothetical protein
LKDGCKIGINVLGRIRSFKIIRDNSNIIMNKINILNLSNNKNSNDDDMNEKAILNEDKIKLSTINILENHVDKTINYIYSFNIKALFIMAFSLGDHTISCDLSRNYLKLIEIKKNDDCESGMCSSMKHLSVKKTNIEDAYIWMIRGLSLASIGIMIEMYMIYLDKLLDYDCIEEIVLLFVQIIVYIFLAVESKKRYRYSYLNK